MSNTELEIKTINQQLKELEERRDTLLKKKETTDLFDETINALEEAETSENTDEEFPGLSEQENQPEDPVKRVGPVKAQFRGRIVKRGKKWAYFELDSKWCRYNPDITLPPRILISINGEADPENPGEPFKNTFVWGFDYNIICDLNVDIERKTKKVVIRYWLNRFSVIIDDV